MKTEVIMERPAFMLEGSSYNGIGEVIEISFNDLRRAEVGERWEALDTHNCGRDLNEESAEVVYKTTDGVAILFRAEGTDNEVYYKEWRGKPTLKWFEFVREREESTL